MADIFQLIQIAAPAATLYELVGTSAGWTKWWAEDVSEAADGTVEVGFFGRSTVYRFQPSDRTPDSQATWKCLGAGEWEGTTLDFAVEPGSPNATLRFRHRDWKGETDYFAMCGATWGELLFRLKTAAEGQSPGPLFSTAGMTR